MGMTTSQRHNGMPQHFWHSRWRYSKSLTGRAGRPVAALACRLEGCLMAASMRAAKSEAMVAEGPVLP